MTWTTLAITLTISVIRNQLRNKKKGQSERLSFLLLLKSGKLKVDCLHRGVFVSHKNHEPLGRWP